MSLIASLASIDNPVADFSDTPWWLSLVKALILFVVIVLSVLLVTWFERRVIGRMQQRLGPNRFGPLGILQTLADGVKLALTEDLTPDKADKVVFVLAPIISGGMAFVSFAIIPMGPMVSMFGHRTPLQLADTPVAVLLVLAAAGVGVYGIVLGGWSSGSPYSLLGGLRSTAQVISYEIAMGLSLIAVFLYSGSMSTSQIVASQKSMWFIIPAFFSFLVYVVTMIGETNRLPFDLAEGEGELGGGFHTEYSSLKWAMYFLGEYVNMFTVSALATTMFLGGWQAPPGIAAINDGMFNQGWWGLLWFVIKLWLFIFFFVWLRGTLVRVRYDQFMRFGWKFLIPVTLLWVVSVAFIHGAQLAFFGGNTGMATIIVVGVISAFALAFAWVWEGRHDPADDLAERPEEIDPFAGGYPIPALPGQRLREPALQGARSLAGSTRPPEADPAQRPELTEQEDNRG